MIYRSTREQIEEYYNVNALNQSAFKVLIKEGIEAFVDKVQMIIATSDLYYEEKEYYVVGKGVDCKMTEGNEEFTRQYHISKLIKKPGEKAMSVIKKIFDQVVLARASIERPASEEIPELGIYKEAILLACAEHDYYPKWGIEAKLNGILREDGGYIVAKDQEPQFRGGGYWEDLKLAGNRQILSDAESATVLSIEKSFRTHPHTEQLFLDRPNVDIVYQFAIYFEIDGVACKILIDKIIIDHNTRKIMPCDIKTIGDYVTNFRRKIKNLRYDIQGSFYSFGLKVGFRTLEKLINKSLSGYTISNFAFIVESTIKQGVPLIFVMTKNLLEQGEFGDNTAEGSLRFGWRHGVEQYKHWKEEYAFSLERRLESTNGVVFVNEDYDYVNL